MTQSRWMVETLLAGNWRGATSALISRGDDHILVDSGMPHQATLLIDALEQRGLKPRDVQAVINTHFHIDHVLNNSLFPQSIIYGTQESFDWCSSLYSDLSHPSDWETLLLKYYPEITNHEGALERMNQMRKLTLRWWSAERLGEPHQRRWLESAPLPEGLEPLFTSGHVPGHVSILVPGADQTTVIAGDAFLTRSNEANILTMIPYNAAQYSEDRRQILAHGTRIMPGHDAEFVK